MVQTLTNITVIEGENSNLTCHVSGIHLCHLYPQGHPTAIFGKISVRKTI